MRSILSATLFSLVFLAAPAVSAKQPASGAPAARASAATPEGAQPSTKAFDVEDPMLAPVESPPHVLSSFKEALTRISSRDVDLKTALAEIEKAKGERRQTLAAALPQITATGSVTVELIRGKVTERDPVSGRTSTIKDPPSPVAAAAFTITQPILAPRAWYAIGTADRTIDLARISSTDTRRQLVSNVADAIVAVMTAERIAEINRAELRSALGRLGLEKRGATLGVSANIDLVRFEQDATAARQTLVDGDEQLREARERLGVALGSTEAFGVPPGIKLDDIETSAEKTCKRGKLRDRADIRALYLKKELSLREVTDADLQYAPTADLSSTLSTSSEAIAGDGHVAWNVMAVITVPIWDGGAKYGARRVAKADVTEAALNIESAERKGTVELTQAERAVVVASRGRELSERARDLARDTKRLAEQAFEGGTGRSFEIVDASAKVRQAELGLALKELELTRAKIAVLLDTATCE